MRLIDMSNIHNIFDEFSLSCECGCVRFNLLRSGKIECDKCRYILESLKWCCVMNKGDKCTVIGGNYFVGIGEKVIVVCDNGEEEIAVKNIYGLAGFIKRDDLKLED